MSLKNKIISLIGGASMLLNTIYCNELKTEENKSYNKALSFQSSNIVEEGNDLMKKIIANKIANMTIYDSYQNINENNVIFKSEILKDGKKYSITINEKGLECQLIKKIDKNKYYKNYENLLGEKEIQLKTCIYDKNIDKLKFSFQDENCHNAIYITPGINSCIGLKKNDHTKIKINKCQLNNTKFDKDKLDYITEKQQMLENMIEKNIMFYIMQE